MKKSTTDEFIKKAKIIHGDKYDYSLVNYITNHKKVKIICMKHGIFEQEPSNHLNKQGCPKCNGKNMTSNDVINKFKSVHGNTYDYSLVNYVNINSKIKIICPKHGIFEQNYLNHLSGNGCPKCYGGVKFTQQQFIEKSKSIHGGKYDYSLVNYINARTKVKIVCPKHGIFEQIPQHHIKGSECPSCNVSKGEKIISVILKEMGIIYVKEKRFKECRYRNPLPFDFFLPELNICIEYDGMQHFRKYDKFGGEKSLEKQIIKDKIKNQFCLDNNIKLIRIRYDEDIKTKLLRSVNPDKSKDYYNTQY